MLVFFSFCWLQLWLTVVVESNLITPHMAWVQDYVVFFLSKVHTEVKVGYKNLGNFIHLLHRSDGYVL